MGTRMGVSTNKGRARTVSSQALSRTTASGSSSLQPATSRRAASSHEREPAVGRYSYGDASSRSFASEPVSGYATGRIAYHQASGAVSSPHVSGGGISRMVANGALSRPVTGRGVSQAYAELGPWLYVVALLIVIALLAFFYLSQTSHVATQVAQMQQLEDQVQELKRQNSDTRVRISAYQDMSRIQREAAAMGFAEPLEREYVEVWLDEPAVAPDNPDVSDGVSRTSGSTGPALASLPAFWSGILQQFQSWVRGGWVPAQSLGREMSMEIQ